MENSIFTWKSKVRDYELDSQGIVNHATFLNYFEQCRNDYARSLGIDFHQYHLKGYDLVVANINVQYRSPLRIKDEFYVTAEIASFNDKRVYIEQEITHKESEKLSAKAVVTIACVNQAGKACMPDILKEKLPPEKYVKISDSC